MPQHNCFSIGSEVSYLNYDVQSVSGEEDDHNCNARAIFLTELRENTYIDISAHAFSVIVVETRTTLRAKLILPSLLMRLF